MCFALFKENDPTSQRFTQPSDDIDIEETQEWLDSFNALLEDKGNPRYILLKLLHEARTKIYAYLHL